METAKAADTMFGNKLYQERARRALPILVRQALACNPINYTDLAEELGMENPRNLNFVLGSVGETLLELEAKWNMTIPLINCLVINKNTGLPGDGISWFFNNGEEFKDLPKKKRRIIVDGKLQEVYTFPRWLDVLKSLGLEPAPIIDYQTLLAKTCIDYGVGTGESESHRIFKEFVSKNPQIVGLPKNLAQGSLEYGLPSGDFVDIVFFHLSDWIAVEVKSKISNAFDIRRGLYQCIKYQAVVEAYQSERGLQPSCRAVLILESELPKQLKTLRNLLGVEVIDKVRIG